MPKKSGENCDKHLIKIMKRMKKVFHKKCDKVIKFNIEEEDVPNDNFHEVIAPGS